MGCISVPTAMLIGTGVQAATGLASGVMGAQAAGSAADIQAAAARQAAQLQMEQFRSTQMALSPFIGAGQGAIPMLSGLLGVQPVAGAGMGPGGGQTEDQIKQQVKGTLEQWASATGGRGGAQGAIDLIDKGAPLSQVMTMLNAAAATTTHPQNVGWLSQAIQQASQIPVSAAGPLGTAPAAGVAQPFSPQQFLEQTPGYQFALSQGLKATQAGYSARGLGGAALKGAAEYSTGLAEQTYGAQVQRYMDLMRTGMEGAGALGRIGAGQVGQIGETTIGAGAAQAAGQIGAAGALAGGIGALGAGGSQYALLQALQAGGMFGAGGGASSMSQFPTGAPTGGVNVWGGPQGFVPAGSWSPYGYAY